MARRDGKFYIDTAKRNPDLVEVLPGKGDHMKFRAKVPMPENMRNTMPCPLKLKGNGTEFAIIKWLRAAGVLIVLSGLGSCLWYFENVLRGWFGG